MQSSATRTLNGLIYCSSKTLITSATSFSLIKIGDGRRGRDGFRVQKKVVTNFCKIVTIYIKVIALICVVIVVVVIIIVNVAILF